MKTTPTPSLDSLIDRQVRIWEVRSRLAEVGGAAARRHLVHLEQGPFLTVSRQFGPLGGWGDNVMNWIIERVHGTSQLGTHLDGLNHIQIGRRFYNGHTLDDLVENYGTNRERVVRRLDERAVGWISEWVNHLLAPESLPQAAFAKDVSEIVCAVGRQGNAVIVGRGANWLVDPRFGIRTRVIVTGVCVQTPPSG